MQDADVLIRLEQEIHSEAKAIVAKAEQEAKTMRVNAEKDASAIAEEAHAQTRARISQLRHRRIQQASLQARQQLVRVKADAVNEAIKQAGFQLTAEGFKSRYRKALAAFLKEALESLKPSKGPFRIITRKEDEAIVKELVSAQNVQASLESVGTFSGGLEIIDEKAKLRVVNTFESRLRQGFETISERVRVILRV